MAQTFSSSSSYRRIVEVYAGIKASNGTGGLASGAPSAGNADLSLEALSELYNSYELAAKAEINWELFS